jgi:hypothetical protein
LGFDEPVLSIATVSGSTELTTCFDRPVLSFVEGLRMYGWGVEAILRHFLTGTEE